MATITDDVISDKGTDAAVAYITKDDKHHEAVTKRFTRAWGCITPEIAQKSRQSSIDNGEGINVYRFLRPSETTSKGNCTYYYADKGCTLWNSILGGMLNRVAFEKAYQHTQTYVVCVSVPVAETGDETAQSVRIFQYDTNKEVHF